MDTDSNSIFGSNCGLRKLKLCQSFKEKEYKINHLGSLGKVKKITSPFQGILIPKKLFI